ncbi:MAG: hypothetical protein L0922_05955, partial [Candidatus Mariimomonas ferrooxydans]
MKYIIIGNGVAGTTAAANIRKLDQSGKITMLTNEVLPFYSRIRLIDYLAGEVDEKALLIYKNDWYKKNNIKLLLTFSPLLSYDPTSPHYLNHHSHPGAPHYLNHHS